MLERARCMRRAATVSEALLWARLRGSRLGVKFRRQHVLGRYIADFYCASAGLVVEVDGAVHSGEVHADRLRDEAMVAWGLRVLRVAASDVERDVEGVLERIRRAL
jgi:very-short-patch-repair endonuclease